MHFSAVYHPIERFKHVVVVVVVVVVVSDTAGSKCSNSRCGWNGHFTTRIPSSTDEIDKHDNRILDKLCFWEMS